MAIKSADQITIIDVTDAYSVILTSEAYTFVGGTGGVASGASCSTQAVAFCGSSQCPSVSVDQSKITCPAGISASVTTNNTSAVTITFTTTATVSDACEASIPVVVDGITVNKKFSFAVAKTGATGQTGATGKGVSSTKIQYQVGTSATTPPTSTWSDTIVATTTGQYLWTKITITYTDNTKSEAYSVAAHGSTGQTGQTGATGKGVKSTAITYQVGTSATSAPTGTWSNSPVSTTAAGQYLWTKIVITYTDNTTSDPAYSVAAHGATGQTGAKGEDAIAVTITSSNGTVFKNSSGSTVLTAHVYVGGVEKTINDNGTCTGYGTIKWYEGDTYKQSSKTYTVSAASVLSTLSVTAKLEG